MKPRKLTEECSDEDILEGLQFSVVVSLDKPRPTNCGHRLPPLKALKRDRPSESEYRYLHTESPERCAGWKNALGQQGSGIVSRQAFEKLLDALDASASGVETLGTLGGPLAPEGGIVADIDFEVECGECIVTLRATPITSDRKWAASQSREEAAKKWEIVRQAVIRAYGP